MEPKQRNAEPKKLNTEPRNEIRNLRKNMKSSLVKIDNSVSLSLTVSQYKTIIYFSFIILRSLSSSLSNSLQYISEF